MVAPDTGGPAPRRPAETVAEIAARIGRPLSTVRNTWTRHPEWPAPTGRRGRWHEYDPATVDAWVRDHIDRPAPGLDPDRLYTAQQLEAAGIGIKAATIRADLSRSRKGGPRRWPEPDETTGANRWRGKTITDALAARQGYRRKRRPDTEPHQGEERP